MSRIASSRVAEPTSRRRRNLMATAMATAVLTGLLLPGASSAAGSSRTVASIGLREATVTTSTTVTGGKFYGPGIAADSLANTQVGGTSCGCTNSMTSYRFRAGQTSRLAAIRIVVVGLGHPGYSAGTGGRMNISIRKDDGTSSHRPSSRSLTSATVVGSSLGSFPVIKFAAPAALSRGQLYHVVFRNVDPSPRANFISVDALMVGSGIVGKRQPKYSDLDWAQLINTGSGWKVRSQYTPILQLQYSNHAVEGVGYMEAWVGDPKTIGGASKVREVFTVSGGDRPIDSVSVRVRRTAGLGALSVRIETAGGTLIQSGTIRAGPTSMAWRTLSFSRLRTLQSGATYNLILAAPAGTTYTTYAVRQGTTYGFHRSTYFAGGRMQYTTGSGWVNTESWGNASTEGDLQFYFH